MCADMMHELSLYQVVSYRLIKFFLPVDEVLISLCSSFVLGMAAANEKYRNILRSEPRGFKITRKIGNFIATCSHMAIENHSAMMQRRQTNEYRLGSHSYKKINSTVGSC